MAIGIGFDYGEDGGVGAGCFGEQLVVGFEAMFGDLHPGLHGFYSMVVLMRGFVGLRWGKRDNNGVRRTSKSRFSAFGQVGQLEIDGTTTTEISLEQAIRPVRCQSVPCDGMDVIQSCRHENEPSFSLGIVGCFGVGLWSCRSLIGGLLEWELESAGADPGGAESECREFFEYGVSGRLADGGIPEWVAAG